MYSKFRKIKFILIFSFITFRSLESQLFNKANELQEDILHELLQFLVTGAVGQFVLLQLPRDRRTLSLLEQVEKKQLEQVSEWTGDLSQDLGAQISEERRSNPQELSVPNINLEEDFIGRFVTSEVEDLLREECEDVMRTLGYNII